MPYDNPKAGALHSIKGMAHQGLVDRMKRKAASMQIASPSGQAAPEMEAGEEDEEKALRALAGG